MPILTLPQGNQALYPPTENALTIASRSGSPEGYGLTGQPAITSATAAAAGVGGNCGISLK